MAAAQDDIPEHLQCPICFEIPKAKVFQCRDGHIICEECYSQLEDCPQCRVPFDRNPIRNRAVETMLSHLKPEKRNHPKPLVNPPRPPVKQKEKNSSHIAPSNFGRVRLTGNSNLKTYGNENRGEIINNSNLKIDSKNSLLKLTDNSNAKIDIKDSTIKASANSNIKLDGEEIDAELYDNSNCKFLGQRCEFKCSSNSNCKFDLDDSDITTSNNSNGMISGNGNIIIAVNNSNLRVTGNNIFLSIRNTSNHCLNPSNEIESSRYGGAINILEISGRFFSGMATSHFDIGYVREADIDGDNYKIGIFQFNLRRMAFSTPEVRYKLVFNYSGFCPHQILIQKVSASEIKITGVKNDVKQSIFLKGKSIEEEGGDKTVFIVTNGICYNRAEFPQPFLWVIRLLLLIIFILVLCIFLKEWKKFIASKK